MKILLNSLILFSFVFISCRGTVSKEPPIHLLQNMDDGGKLDPQSQNLASYELDEEPYEDLNRDGKWSPTEPFEDLNENGHWDKSGVEYISAGKTSMLYMPENTVATDLSSEEFTDALNGIWDEDEEFTDDNENGIWDEGEDFIDVLNGVYDDGEDFIDVLNGVYDDGEDFIDSNKNKKWDKFKQISDIDVEEAISFDTGKDNKGKYIRKNPKTVDLELLNRGEERYNIYCSACHGISGNGNGVVLHKNYSWKTGVKPANLLDLSDKEDIAYDGYLFDVISNGKNRMGGYGAQIGVDDRWAIVAYLRVLDYASGGCNDYSSIKNSLNNISSLEGQLMSNDFECLIELGKVQEYYNKQMKEIQKIVKCDDYDGQWGQGTKRKWNDWKKSLINED